MGFRSGMFEVADNVYNIVSRHDGAVSFMQMLPKPMVSKQSDDKFADSHPLLIICADGSFSGGNNIQEGSDIPWNGSTQQCQESLNRSCVPTLVWFYSLRSQSYVHLLRFRSVVHLVRCSSRVVAVLQSSQVIVRDIVGKTVIAQFRAHKSPILLLCFDPSGTLLVTASVQGHTVNVFRIMPELSGGTSEATSGPSYVHLYRLQRGFTNAVIQDISFSSDSQWIMISSLRGTSHLFAISPYGGLVSFQSNDACLSPRSSGSSFMAKPAGWGSPNSGLQILTQQSICASGPPVTLSAVSRIRNGSNGWRNTVSGAAAAATGRMSSLSSVITSVFCNCKGNDICADNSSIKKNYYLLVFSPAGCVTQYALRISPAYNGSMSLPGASVTCEFGIDGDARLMVEPIQKWNICQKQNCKERENNVDLYAENGNSDCSKVYPERMKQNNVFLDVSRTRTKEKISIEEKNQMYISEAELQMHQNRNPLWTRSEIYFQSMLTDGSDMDEDGACNGETEIERVPIRMLEARSKDLVPVFDYIHAPKYQQRRTSAMNDKNNGQFECQGSDASGNGRLASISNGVTIVNESNNTTNEPGQDGVFLSTETSGGFVNTNDSPVENAQLEAVNTRENCDS
ncbi:UNVERIFIED_CONTAM: Autophagy-related protein 18f [Sesamum latifolium]|uniref:Autophagy-related protein 18f n=1 Tax=Sesamum latifolium TaxID=2727402 RepID=A0AAW2WRQ2_9LAMI